jgi:hypothetical protein
MNAFSHWARVLLGAAALTALTSCGDSANLDTTHAPTLTGLSYSPTTTFQAAAGTVVVDATVVFADAGSDVTAMRITSTAGTDLTVPKPSLTGVQQGTSATSFSLPADRVGKTSFEIWLVDAGGSASNRLSGSVDVVAADGPTPDHPPLTSGLSYSPVTATQTASGSVVVSATVTFADTGGDVVAMRIMSSAGTDLTVPMPSLSGVQNGASATAFTLPVDSAGKISFDVWLVDGSGSSSNRLSGSVDVVTGPTPAHAPSIAGLKYSPSAVAQAAGGTVVVNAAVVFSDSDADVTAMRITSTAGTDLTVPMPSLSGIQNGTGATTFTLPVDKVGKISFAVSVVDRQGTRSNPLAGVVDVVASVLPDTWVRLPATPPATLFGLTWDGRRYVAVGGGGTVMTAADLNGWSVQTSGVGHTLRSVAASPARFVAVGDDASGEAVVISSTDGSAWSVQYRAGGCQGGSCATPSQLSKVIWTGTQFVAVGQERIVSAGKLYGLVLTSPDGTTWTQRAAKAIELGSSEFANERDMTSVAWSGSVFVAVGLGTGLDPAAWVSADAQTWTAGSIPAEPAVALFPWSDVTWGSGRFVAVGSAPGWFPAGAHTPVFTSADGMNWLASSSSAVLPPMRAVTAGANEYVAVGDTNRESSTNGIDWTVTVASDCGRAVLWDGMHYVAVGQSICRSP